MDKSQEGQRAGEAWWGMAQREALLLGGKAGSRLSDLCIRAL